MLSLFEEKHKIVYIKDHICQKKNENLSFCSGTSFIFFSSSSYDIMCKIFLLLCASTCARTPGMTPTQAYSSYIDTGRTSPCQAQEGKKQQDYMMI